VIGKWRSKGGSVKRANYAIKSFCVSPDGEALAVWQLMLVLIDSTAAKLLRAGAARDPELWANSISRVGNYCSSWKALGQRETKRVFSYGGFGYRSTAGVRAVVRAGYAVRGQRRAVR